MEAFRQQFLNVDIMMQAWPIILQGLQMTLLL